MLLFIVIVVQFVCCPLCCDCRNKRTKPAPRRSIWWDLFVDNNDGTAKCIIKTISGGQCGTNVQKYGASTTQMIRHVGHHHPQVYAAYLHKANPTTAKNAAARATAPVDVIDLVSIPFNDTIPSHFGPAAKLAPNHPRQLRYEASLASWALKHNIPFAALDSKDLKDAVAYGGSDVRHLSSTAMSTRHLPIAWAQYQSKVANMAKESRVCVGFDGWTDKTMNR